MTYDRPAPTTDGSALLSTFDALSKSGLVLYDESQKVVEHTDGNLKFHFVLTKALIKKPTLSTPKHSSASGDGLSNEKQLLPGSDIDTNGFEMGDSGNSTHFLIANKFCFSRPHLMMLTRDGYRRQYEPLDQSDFDAAWGTLASLENETTEYVVFFNCGKDGGCSRLHKHVQLMPLPASGFAVDFLNSNITKEPKVPFEWFYHRFQDGATAASKVTEVYTQLLRQATEAWKASTGKDVPDRQACPHNVAFTSRWIVVIPRRTAAVNKEAGVNSLGMLGVIAVATEKEIENWVKLGLTNSLRELGVPRNIVKYRSEWGKRSGAEGPALLPCFTAQDFPALQPTRSHEEDFASFIQAQVELTTLFGNVHDIPFAARPRTAELIMRGDYTKYVDDATEAMCSWQHAWTSLAVSPRLKSYLNLMQEYPRFALLPNAHACGAISSGKYAHVTSLMERFISALKATAVDDSHIAAAYETLLERL
ncbi:ATP adenylyltransferase II [Fusarium sp. NRRL 25303]|nr:ATP adenylyltransferase II [Fusarium sp. NRRL 25303]